MVQRKVHSDGAWMWVRSFRAFKERQVTNRGQLEGVPGNESNESVCAYAARICSCLCAIACKLGNMDSYSRSQELICYCHTAASIEHVSLCALYAHLRPLHLLPTFHVLAYTVLHDVLREASP